jgi:hypothetical protein
MSINVHNMKKIPKRNNISSDRHKWNILATLLLLKITIHFITPREENAYKFPLHFHEKILKWAFMGIYGK